MDLMLINNFVMKIGRLMKKGKFNGGIFPLIHCFQYSLQNKTKVVNLLNVKLTFLLSTT